MQIERNKQLNIFNNKINIIKLKTINVNINLN